MCRYIAPGLPNTTGITCKMSKSLIRTYSTVPKLTGLRDPGNARLSGFAPCFHDRPMSRSSPFWVEVSAIALCIHVVPTTAEGWTRRHCTIPQPRPYSGMLVAGTCRAFPARTCVRLEKMYPHPNILLCSLVCMRTTSTICALE